MQSVKRIAKILNQSELVILNKTFVSGLLLSSLLVGCAGMNKQESADQELSSRNEQAQADVQTVEAQQAKPVIDSAPKVAATEKKPGEASADALMATLKKPIEEPVAQPDEQKVMPIEKAGSVVVAQAGSDESVHAKVVPVVKPPAAVTIKKENSPGVKTQVNVAETVAKTMPAKQPVASSKKSASKSLAIRKSDLPYTYDIWQLKQGVAALEKGLVIATPTWEMGKEGYMSQIWLTLMENQILVNSSSDIDNSADALGIKINNGELIPFTRIEGNNIGVIEGEYLDQLEGGGKMNIYLGFFPGKRPTSDVFETDIDLDSLSRVIPTYRILLK